MGGTMLNDSYDFIHRNMAATTPEARSVGSITLGADSGPTVRGSGVLIGGRYVLTAAHLVDDARVGVFTINGQDYGMNRWVVANQFYNRGADDDPNPDERIYSIGADLALVELDRRVVGARNLKAKISKNRNEAGQTATIVGFGTPGNGEEGIFSSLYTDNATLVGAAGYQPVKRAGKNVIEPNSPFAGSYKFSRELRIDFDPDPSQLASLTGLGPPQLDLFTGEWDIDENDIPITGEFMPSIGDSGGGLFINGRLAGITSWTTRDNSEFFSTASFTRLSTGWWKWIRDNIRAFNHAQNNPSATPWLSVENGGNGFRGVARILFNDDVEDDDGNLIVAAGQPFNIFGPRLFYDFDIEAGTLTHFDVTQGVLEGLFVSGDLFAHPGPLSDVTNIPYPFETPEPASLALLGLGGLATLRRARR
jgi:hypothetical protein